MSFANSSALFWTLLAIPIVIFYLRKIRMRRVPVSAVMFWQQVFDEKPPRSIRHQLRHLLSLLLQLIFLALIVSALGDPIPTDQVGERRRLVIVVDNSASMQVADQPEGTRLNAARQIARQMIRHLKPQDEMAILTAGSSVEVVCGLTDRQRTLERHLDELKPTHGHTTVAEAVTVAERLLVDHPQAQIIVLSDGCSPDAARRSAAENVFWKKIGATADNVGITQFQVRRSLANPVGYEVLIEVRNFSSAMVECSLDLSMGDSLLDVMNLKLSKEEIWTRVIEKTSLAGGVVSAKLTFPERFSGNALLVDDTAWAILAKRARIPVTLVTDGSWFLERVLEANDLVDLTVTDEIPATISLDEVLVLHRKTPDRIPAGSVFVVQPTASTELWQLVGAIEQPLVGWQDDAAPLLQHVQLQHVLMPEAEQIRPVVSHSTLVESASGEPLYVHIPRPVGDILVLPVNLELSDLPLRTAFPIMLTNALSWFAKQSSEFLGAVSTGETVEFSLPAELASGDGEELLRLSHPVAGSRIVRARNGEAAIGALSTTGIWTLTPLKPPDGVASSVSGPARQEAAVQLACNLSDPEESDLRPRAKITERKLPVETGLAGHPVWFQLTLAALLLIMLEWLFFNRRWIS